MTCSGRAVAMASFMIGIDEVLEASTASGSVTTRSSMAKVSSFSASSSGTASTTSWRSASASGSLVTVIRAEVDALSSSDNLPRRTAWPSEASMRSRPASDRRRVALDDHHVDAGASRDLGDARAHEPTAHHPHPVHVLLGWPMDASAPSGMHISAIGEYHFRPRRGAPASESDRSPMLARMSTMGASPSAAEPITDDWVTNHFDHLSPRMADQLTESLARMRGVCPVAHSQEWGGFWVVSRYEDVLAGWPRTGRPSARPRGSPSPPGRPGWASRPSPRCSTRPSTGSSSASSTPTSPPRWWPATRPPPG